MRASLVAPKVPLTVGLSGECVTQVGDAHPAALRRAVHGFRAADQEISGRYLGTDLDIEWRASRGTA